MSETKATHSIHIVEISDGKWLVYGQIVEGYLQAGGTEVREYSTRQDAYSAAARILEDWTAT